MNSAIAVELMELIVDEIEGSQARALDKPMPDWLGRLVTLWDRLEATVVTFNYDMLIEYAVQSAGMPWMTFPEDTTDIFRGLPNPAVGALPVGAMFSLLKMHGSVGWWSLPEDRIGTTIIRGELAGQWNHPAPLAGPAGFERFIIPPLAVKTSYLDLGPVRELWRRARHALETASRVVVMGYSSPLTDLATAALLSLHIPKQVPVVVVDPAAELVIDRLRTLGHEQFEVFDGQDAVANFAASYESSVGPSLTTDLYELLQSAPVGEEDRVVVRTLGGLWAPAVSLIDEEGSPLVIEAGDPTAEFKDLEQAILVGDLRPALFKAKDSGSAVVMRFPQLPDRIALHLSARVFSANVLAVEG